MKASLEIQNLKCGGCAESIRRKLAKIGSLENLVIDETRSLVSFDYAEDSGLSCAKEALSSLGYPTVDDQNSFGQKARSYLSCATGRFLK
ncbi:heavy-metal-associated domain-containing protein [Poritiphilus flavus]|uniref:Heavy metal transporter n=1 Tax=Poritiphilus flavus TaxID=2697053 RepID=A0A6L9EBW9_9FLAO|nr:heavy-metal-associated domain-containing protein [Poritiphilus flavus]NAS11909.1 heavy metal transporter [Poritiphilus flavus]